MPTADALFTAFGAHYDIGFEVFDPNVPLADDQYATMGTDESGEALLFVATLTEVFVNVLLPNARTYYFVLF